MRPRFCGSGGSLLKLWGILFPVRTYMIRCWPLFWCLLWSPGRCMPGFPRLCYSGGYRWTCLGFPWVLQWGGGSLWLWLSVLWFVLVFRGWCSLKGLDRVFLVQGWSVCGWPSILIAGVGGMVARYGRFGGKYCILMESISTLWSVLPGYMSQSVCGGGGDMEHWISYVVLMATCQLS